MSIFIAPFCCPVYFALLGQHIPPGLDFCRIHFLLLSLDVCEQFPAGNRFKNLQLVKFSLGRLLLPPKELDDLINLDSCPSRVLQLEFIEIEYRELAKLSLRESFGNLPCPPYPTQTGLFLLDLFLLTYFNFFLLFNRVFDGREQLFLSRIYLFLNSTQNTFFHCSFLFSWRAR